MFSFHVFFSFPFLFSFLSFIHLFIFSYHVPGNDKGGGMSCCKRPRALTHSIRSSESNKSPRGCSGAAASPGDGKRENDRAARLPEWLAGNGTFQNANSQLIIFPPFEFRLLVFRPRTDAPAPERVSRCALVDGGGLRRTCMRMKRQINE